MRTSATTVNLLAILAATCVLAGCVGYSSYPGLEHDTALNDTNTPAMKQVTLEALRYVVKFRELPDQYALNLPHGMVAERMQGILVDLDDNRATLLSHTNQDLPRLHISRIQIRGYTAQVEIAAPLPGVFHPTGELAYESNTIYLNGGTRHWRVTDARRWSIANSDVPEPYFLDNAPTIERTNTAQATVPSSDQ